MDKKIKNWAISIAFGVSSALGIGYIMYNYPQKAEAQEKKFYEKKEQVGVASFRYTLDNKVCIDVTYKRDGSLGVCPLGDDMERIRLSYDKEKNITRCNRSGHFLIVDKGDDGLVEQIYNDPCLSLNDLGKLLPQKNYKEIYQKGTNLLKKLKDLIKWKDLKKEASKFGYSKEYLNSYDTFVDFLRTFNKTPKEEK